MSRSPVAERAAAACTSASPKAAALDVDACCSGVDLDVRARRDAGHRRRLGLGQEHAAAPAGRARRADRGQRRSCCGRDFATLDAAEQGAWRNRHLGFVYQFHHLLPEFSALDNVAMPLRIRRVPPARGARARAPRRSAQVGLGERAAAPAGASSRAASASAWRSRARWSTQPACVLADEPTGNLDRGTADGVFELMLELARHRGTAFVMVTHDESLAARCDRRLHLAQGRLVL